MTKHRRAIIATSAFTLALILGGCGSNTRKDVTEGSVDAQPPAAATPSPAASGVAARHLADTASTTLVVYKSPTCGCCTAWVDHMKENGFTVEVHDTPDVTPVKLQGGIASDLHSCHTAFIGGYALEGHVPAADVQRLLRERPAVIGLAVPGMPMGSPGMEGGTKQRYDVLAFDRGGSTTVFASH